MPLCCLVVCPRLRVVAVVGDDAVVAVAVVASGHCVAVGAAGVDAGGEGGADGDGDEARRLRRSQAAHVVAATALAARLVH